jgi:hypothetical protein
MWTRRGAYTKNVGAEDVDCEGIGKREGRIFWEGGFENLKGDFVHFDEHFNLKGVRAPRWENFPKAIPGSTEQTPEIRSFMRKESLYAQNRYVIPLGNDESLLFEQALTASENSLAPARTVLYVYQSISNDYGKTWSTPILTKEAKLFEVGRLLTEQSWSPKVETLVRHR